MIKTVIKYPVRKPKEDSKSLISKRDEFGIANPVKKSETQRRLKVFNLFFTVEV
jgi:hypothetical protein